MKKVVNKKNNNQSEVSIENFRRDPKFAADYLDKFLRDGNEKEVLSALRYVAEAFGGTSKIAEKAGLNGTSIYRTLSEKGNPRLQSLTGVLKAMGMRLSVEAIRG